MLMAIRSISPALFAIAMLAGCAEKDSSDPQPLEQKDDGAPASADIDPNSTPEPAPAKEELPQEKDEPAPEPQPDNLKGCKEAWNGIINNAQTGRRVEHEYTDVATENGIETRFKSRTTQVVTDSNPQFYTVDITRQSLEPRQGEPKTSSLTVMKGGYMERCLEESPSADVKVPQGYTYEQIEKRSEQITVPAGTFDTVFLHYRVKGKELGMEYDSEIRVWTLTDGSGITVKSISENTSKSGSSTRKNVSENVLIVLERP